MLHILGQSEAFYPCHRLSMTFGPLYMSYFGFHWAAKKNRSFKCLNEKLCFHGNHVEILKCRRITVTLIPHMEFRHIIGAFLF